MLPTAHAHHRIASRISGVLAGQHATGRAANHDRIEGLRRGVALAVIHAPAHVGVQGQVVVLHQDLSFLQRLHGWHGRVDQREVLYPGLALGACDEVNLLIDLGQVVGLACSGCGVVHG